MQSSETPEKSSAKTTHRLEQILTVICGLSLLGGWSVESFWQAGPLSLALWILAYLSGGWFGTRSGLASLRKLEVDVDLLMILAAAGAAWIGHPLEGGMLLFLFSLSNMLQSRAMERSRQAIQSLMTLRPDTVHVWEEGRWVDRPVEDVGPGARILVKPGENIALDGTVVRGTSSLDEASLTGESFPVAKEEGDSVFAGTLNQEGSLEINVLRPASDSTLARIVSMVEEAQSSKADRQRFLEKAEKGYALGVILMTIGLIFIPWKVMGHEFSATFYQAMTAMVVASPCALVISTPAAFLSAIGGAARKGVLFKGGVHLERLADVRTMAFDKTGTLTQGKPKVTRIIPFGESEAELLSKAAAVESHSEHPLAQAILRAAGEQSLTYPEPEAFRSIPGKGATAQIRNATIAVGSLEWLAGQGLEPESDTQKMIEDLRDGGNTLVGVADLGDDHQPGRITGLIAVRDTPRPDAAQMIAALRKRGIKRVVLLTGDHPRVAQALAREIGIDEVYAGLLPEQKVEEVRTLAETSNVAMVGDGVNDAPALAAAHVGIAMGASGSDVAMETADVVLMSDQLHHLVNAYALSRRARRVVTQNLVFALSVIALLLVGTFFFSVSLPLGVVGHEGSTVLVCLNGLRLLRFTV